MQGSRSDAGERQRRLMNILGKPTNQSPNAVHGMRGFKFSWCHQIIDELTSSCEKAPVGLPSTRRISSCWQAMNDCLYKLPSQNMVRNFGLSTYLLSREVTLVKQGDCNIDGSACRRLRRQLGEGALRDGSIRGHLTRALNCKHRRFVRTAVSLMPIRNDM